MTWTDEVVSFLCDAKIAGVDYQEAWLAALREHPPSGVGLGQRQLAMGEEETLIEFFARVTEDAWYGRRPTLQYLSVDLLDREDQSFAETHGRVH